MIDRATLEQEVLGQVVARLADDPRVAAVDGLAVTMIVQATVAATLDELIAVGPKVARTMLDERRLEQGPCLEVCPLGETWCAHFGCELAEAAR